MEYKIHYFKCSEGVHWMQFHHSLLSECTDLTVPVAAFLPSIKCFADGKDMSTFVRSSLQNVDVEHVICIPVSYAKMVKEYVPATVKDAFDALEANAYSPVSGWKFDSSVRNLTGASVLPGKEFQTGSQTWSAALRPILRVQLRQQKPMFKVGDLVKSKETEQVYRVVELSNYDTKRYLVESIESGLKLSALEQQFQLWSPGYGYTESGQAVPPPPDGWRVARENSELPFKYLSCIHASDGLRWVTTTGLLAGEAAIVSNGVRAYAVPIATQTAADVQAALLQEYKDWVSIPSRVRKALSSSQNSND